jgi:ferric-dicitrate binding protein FerR (iron transport regulator)
MSDRYLWDKQGEPDREIERLERVLSPLAHRGEPLALPAESAPRRWPAPRLAWALAAAAALVMVASGALWWSQSRGWEVVATSGAPRLGARRLGAPGRATAGEWLVTDAGSSARIQVGDIGVVDLGPNSRLRLIGRKGVEHRLALERGVLDAVILAPPRRFVVETPSATAVDLGCVYTLEVDGSGAGLLTVAIGWVSFEVEGRESFIPAGARCATRPGVGPGTPYFTDAAPALKNALALVDLGGPAASGAALDTVLAAARREDAFTLWHLLARVPEPARARVYDCLAVLAPPPAGVERAGAIAGDRAMLDRWWDALGFGGTKDWRRWRGPYPAGREPVRPR